MRYISAVHWEQGGRLVNEDSVSLQEVRLHGKTVILALVCDGIGGLFEGETASGFVAERITEWFYREALIMLGKNKSAKKVVKAAQRVLYECNEELGEFSGNKGRKTGTTATIVLICKKRYLLWHTGDTRGYRISSTKRKIGKGKIKVRQLTQDHIAYNHALIRCIGSFPWQMPDTEIGYVKKGETILLCSDGFRNRIEEEKMGEALQQGGVETKMDLKIRLREIAEYVKRKGETDNISAIVVRRV